MLRSAVFFKNIKLLILLLIFSFFMSSVCSAASGVKLSFGWNSGGEFVKNSEVATELARYLAQKTGFAVTAVHARTEGELESMLKLGKVDLCFIPNFKYKALADRVDILSTPKVNGSRYIQLYIIVSASSNIHSMQQLRGRRAGKVKSSSRLQCNFLASAIHGDVRRYFRTVKQFRKLKDAVYEVADGKIDATCLNSAMYALLIKYDPSLAKRIRIIKKSPVYPLHPLVISSEQPEEVKSKLKATLFLMADDYSAQNILMLMGIDAFGEPVTVISKYPRPTSYANVLFKKPTTSRAKKDKAEKSSPSVKQTRKAEKDKQVPTGSKVVKPVKLSEISEKQTVPKVTPKAVNATSPGEQAPEAKGKEKLSANETSVASATAQRNTESESANSQTKQSTESYEGNITVPQSGISRHVGDISDIFQKQGKSIQNAGLLVAAVAIFIIFVKIVFRLLRRQKLTVVTTVKDKLVSMQCIMDSEKDVAFKACTAFSIPENFGEKSFWQRYLDNINHLKGMNLLAVISSDRCRLHYYVTPIIPDAEIYEAVEWKLKEDNIPYDKEEDILQCSIIQKDKKNKKLLILAEVFNRQDVKWAYPEGKPVVDSLVSIESCLLNCLIHAQGAGQGGHCAMIYFFNKEEAVMIYYHYGSNVFSRRLYANQADSGPPELKDKSPVNAFATDIEQTLRYFRDRFGPVNVMYMCGEGIVEDPDPEGILGEYFYVTVRGLDVFQGVKDSTELLNVCPQPEIMIGAARAWFNAQKRL